MLEVQGMTNDGVVELSHGRQMVSTQAASDAGSLAARLFLTLSPLQTLSSKLQF